MTENSCGNRSIVDSQILTVTAERAFRTLISPSEIQIWWQAKSVVVLPRKNGFWCASWGKDMDNPDYVMSATLSEFEPSKRLVMSDFQYASRSGPEPRGGAIRTEYLIEAIPDNDAISDNPKGCLLTVTQSGFPPAGDADTDQFYNGCVAGWRSTLQAIDDYFNVA